MLNAEATGRGHLPIPQVSLRGMGEGVPTARKGGRPDNRQGIREGKGPYGSERKLQYHLVRDEAKGLCRRIRRGNGTAQDGEGAGRGTGENSPTPEATQGHHKDVEVPAQAHEQDAQDVQRNQPRRPRKPEEDSRDAEDAGAGRGGATGNPGRRGKGHRQVRAGKHQRDRHQ